MTPIAPTKLLALLSQTTGMREAGSPHGMSVDIRATTCGLQAVFAAAVPRRPSVFPQRFFNAKGKATVLGHRAGTVFHSLQELWRTDRLEDKALPLGSAFEDIDESVGAALDAFRRYAGQNLGSPNFLGQTVATEFSLAGTIAGQPRTGRVDAVLKASEEHIERWAEYGVFTAQPGLYLWDYKLLSAVSASSAPSYQRSMQALAYMHLYEQQTGLKPEGFIYELVSRAKKPDTSRMLVQVPNGHDNLKILEGFVRLATKRHQEGDADASKCDNHVFEACPFISVCPREGTAEQHKEIIYNHALLKNVNFELETET